MADSVLPAPTIKPKRTRIVGPQSKNGCLTCKSRRIKCDEDKPGCARCARSGFLCEGYPDRVRDIERRAVHPLELRSLLEPSPMLALKSGCTENEQQYRFSQLGMRLLVLESFNRFGAAAVVLDVLLPQLCHSLPSVNAAATALGTVYHRQAFSGSGPTVDEAFAASFYRAALCSIRQDLSTQPDGPVPLILICFMLSIVEIFLQQESNALFHIRGAFRLLQQRGNTRHEHRRTGANACSVTSGDPDDAIEVLFRTIDFQTCSFAMSKTPELPIISMTLAPSQIKDLNSAHDILVQLVHNCYTFTSSVYKFKYSPGSANSDLFIQQGRYIAQLSIWLEQFNLVVLRTLHQELTSSSQITAYSHALILRMTALSTLIYISCILCPYERAYDAHAAHFQQIIEDGEAIISSDSVTGRADHCFVTGPGLIQPLFLTAYKYRRPLHRRRALRLLSLAGCEGPWSGPREACITSRIMELEEKWSTNSFLMTTCAHSGFHEGSTALRANKEAQLLNQSPINPSSVGRGNLTSTTTATMDMPSIAEISNRASSFEIPQFADPVQPSSETEISETSRIHGMGMSSERAHGRSSQRVTVRFSRCRSIEGMLSYPCGHKPQNHGLDPHSQGPCSNNIYWEIWTETLEV